MTWRVQFWMGITISVGAASFVGEVIGATINPTLGLATAALLGGMTGAAGYRMHREHKRRDWAQHVERLHLDQLRARQRYEADHPYSPIARWGDER